MTLQIGDQELLAVFNMGYQTAKFNAERNHLPQLSKPEVRAVFNCFIWFSVAGCDGVGEVRSFSDPDVKDVYDWLEAGYLEGYRSYYQ